MKRLLKKILKRIKKKPETMPSSFEEQIYMAIVEKNDTCMDVGANDGGVSMFLSRLLLKNKCIYAIEPVWRNYRQMLEYIQNDSGLIAKILPIPIGFSETPSIMTVNIPDGDYGMGSIAQKSAWSNAVKSTENIQSETCYFLNIDTFFETTKSEWPDFVKIDVEGAELSILKGAKKMLENGWRPILFMEVFAPWEKAFGYSPWDLFEYLIKFDYRIKFVIPSGIVDYTPSPSAPFPPEFIEGYNIIAYNHLHMKRISKLEKYNSNANNPNVLSMPPVSFPNVIN